MINLHTHIHMPFKTRAKQLLSLPFALSIMGLTISPLIAAEEQEWWFDVEVIVFERNLATQSMTESFPQSDLTLASDEWVDLLTEYMHPDLSYLRAGLDYCSASKQLVKQQQYDADFALTLDDATAQVFTEPSFEIIDEPQIQSVTNATGLDDIEGQVDLPVQANVNADENKPDVINQQVIDDPMQLAATQETPVATEPEATRTFKVDWIEWQLPSQLPCAYAEQVDPQLHAPSQTLADDRNNVARITETPIKIDGIEWQSQRGPFLIPQSSMFMQDLYDSINQQTNISPILHMSWRQQVKFGRENAQEFRLFAGRNYADDFDHQGLPILPDSDSIFENLTEHYESSYVPKDELVQAELEGIATTSPDNKMYQQFMAKIDDALADDSPLDVVPHNSNDTEQSKGQELDNSIQPDIWQLDGKVAVYLRNVGRVPYLHIDSNLAYRHPIFDPNIGPIAAASLVDSSLATNQPIDMSLSPTLSRKANFLQNANFNQLRRIISKQVHYFDHPLFGMIIRLNRFEWPEIEDIDETDNDQAENN